MGQISSVPSWDGQDKAQEGGKFQEVGMATTFKRFVMIYPRYRQRTARLPSAIAERRQAG